jgi:RluA family pseudouridine synthase
VVQDTAMPAVIFENKYLIALNKPTGLITHSDGRTIEPSVAEWVAGHYPVLRGIGEPWVSPQGEVVQMNGVVHRLDRATSGVLLVAKSNEIFTYLRGEFKARRVEKVYRAIVYGHMEKDEGRIVAEIDRTTTVPKRWYAKLCEESNIRAAVTDWNVLSRGVDEAGERYTYVEARPKTGRTHQIRVHFAFVGYPLVSDHLYASDRVPMLGFTRPALHAYSISLVLPNHEKLSYCAPLPPDFVSNL